MTVLMTDDQLQVLIATMRGITDSNQNMNLLRSWAGAELYEQVVESMEQTRLKRDQMWPGTREWEEAVQARGERLRAKKRRFGSGSPYLGPNRDRPPLSETQIP